MNSLADTNVWQIPVAFLDFETTGLAVETGDRVVEVAIIRAKHMLDSNPTRYQRLVQPGIPVPKSSFDIHGIDDDMLTDAPPFADLLPDIRTLLSGALVIAHHAPFDIGFLDAECDYAQESPVSIGPVLDTLKLARALFGFPSCSLSALAARMNVTLTNHHRALADCTATFEVCTRMLECIDSTHRLTVNMLNQRIIEMTHGGAIRGQMQQTFLEAAKDRSTLEIDYTRVQGHGELKTTRKITVESWRPPNVEAWCHLRNQKRVFRLDRIQDVRPVNEQN